MSEPIHFSQTPLTDVVTGVAPSADGTSTTVTATFGGKTIPLGTINPDGSFTAAAGAALPAGARFTASPEAEGTPTARVDATGDVFFGFILDGSQIDALRVPVSGATCTLLQLPSDKGLPLTPDRVLNIAPFASSAAPPTAPPAPGTE